MTTKTKTRLHAVLEENKKIRFQRQAMVRTLCAVLHHQGTLQVPYQAAALVEDSDAVQVDFDKETGMYTISLVNHEADAEEASAVTMGSGSNAAGLQIGEGNVGGAVQEAQPDGVDDDVREGD